MSYGELSERIVLLIVLRRIVADAGRPICNRGASDRAAVQSSPMMSPTRPSGETLTLPDMSSSLAILNKRSSMIFTSQPSSVAMAAISTCERVLRSGKSTRAMSGQLLGTGHEESAAITVTSVPAIASPSSSADTATRHSGRCHRRTPPTQRPPSNKPLRPALDAGTSPLQTTDPPRHRALPHQASRPGRRRVCRRPASVESSDDHVVFAG